MQAALLSNPRKAREIAVVQLLTGDYGLYKVQAHSCLHTTRNQEGRPDTYAVVDAVNGAERCPICGTIRCPIFCVLRDSHPGGYPAPALPSSSFTTAFSTPALRLLLSR